MSLIAYAAKSLLGRRKKYLFLYIAITFGFFIMTFGAGITEGMLESVREKGAFYFTGNVNVELFSHDEKYLPLDVSLATAAAKDAAGRGARISLRSVYYSTDAQLFGGAGSARQRRVIGVDWDAERGLFSSMNFVSGGLPSGDGERAILISEGTAKKLGAAVGDSVTLLVTARGGKNTVPAVVAGIFRETSIFGYASYLSRPYLNAGLGREAGDATDLGIYLGAGQDELRVAKRLRERLAGEVPTFPLVRTRDEQNAHFEDNYEGTRYMVMTLDAHLSSITQILGAISMVAYFLLAIFLLIVLIGISNTYRVVVYERRSEIGTMRALGMSRARAVAVFVEEAAMLALAAALAGFLLAVGALAAFSLLDFSSSASLGMFLRLGRFSWAFDPLSVIAAFAIVCATTLLAAWAPARKAALVDPALAMRAEG